MYGYFDKSSLLNLFQNLFNGNEKEVINIYRNIYDKGIEPKIFLNDFLEILYYFKNISSIKLEGSDFSLNDEEFKIINKISGNLNPRDIILFWEYTIRTLNEIEIVSNPNLSVEMFLIRLMYLKNIKEIDGEQTNQKILNDSNESKNKLSSPKSINQIKNTSQEEKLPSKIESNNTTDTLNIKSFEELVSICNNKKEIKLKYELETNVNLVSFSDGRIEIGFNDNLDKNFIKDLSNKLFIWTDKRWIISLSKIQHVSL